MKNWVHIDYKFVVIILVMMFHIVAEINSAIVGENFTSWWFNSIN